MAITTELLRSYRAPRDAMRRQLDGGVREDRALAYAMAACVLIFVSTLPGLAREAYLDAEVPLDARIGAALFAWVIVMPLALYVLAALSHLLARLFGGRGSWFSARMALFWALLAAAPLWLLNGLGRGFLAPGTGQMILEWVAFGGFLVLWSLCLSEAESASEKEAEA